jgi:hypothetical protein
MILLISASQGGRITGIRPQQLASLCLLIRGLNLLTFQLLLKEIY